MAKDKFKNLDLDEQDKIASLKGDDLVAYIAQTALNQAELMKAKEEDQDLAEKREAAKDAGAQYRDGTKMNKLRVEFAKRVMEDRTGDFVASIKSNVEAARKTSNEDREDMN